MIPTFMVSPLFVSLLFAGYVYAFFSYYRRFPQKPPAWLRLVSCAAGFAVIAMVLTPRFDALADRSFTWHMTQHLALMLVAPPLLLLGAPIVYVMGTLPQATASAIGRTLHAQPLATLLSPVVSWLIFVGVMWISHFSPLYNAALEHPLVHACEHALYVSAALLFWMHVIDTGVTAHPLSFPARMLYVFLAVPQGAFLGVALLQSRYPLYAHYRLVEPGAVALTDQHNSGALMWIGGGLILFTTFMLCAGAWAARERAPEIEYR